MNKIDAVSEAKKLAKQHGWGYAVECRDGSWEACRIKPSLRYGKVFEYDEAGIERFA